MRVAALFARRDSVYRALGCDVYDEERDALSFGMDAPVVAHPPCRAWGQLRHLANPRAGERELALWALDVVRCCGGVLEHPAASGLWAFVGRPGVVDAWGGCLLMVDQVDWGHRARKRTGLYCVRTTVRPRLFGVARTTVERMCRAERERTPYELAHDLVEAARRAA